MSKFQEGRTGSALSVDDHASDMLLDIDRSDLVETVSTIASSRNGSTMQSDGDVVEVAHPSTADDYPFGHDLTDQGDALRMADAADGQIRHCEGVGWLAWDGRRFDVRSAPAKVAWCAQKAKQLVLEEASAHNRAASRCVTDEGRESQTTRAIVCGKRALSMQSSSRNDGRIKLFKSVPSTVVWEGAEALDSQPRLLNCRNGVLDLDTLELHPHDPSLLMTKLAGCDWLGIDAQCPFIDSTLDKGGVEADAQRFLWQMGALSLLGLRSKQIVVLIGDTENGKSTFLNALNWVLGDYWMSIRPDVLVSNRKDLSTAGALDDLADLRGARMASTTEPPSGRFTDDVIKRVTGEPTLKTKKMNQSHIVFPIQATVWVSVNSEPDTDGADPAMRRRVAMVRFPNRIADPLPDEVTESRIRAELPGVLARCVRALIELDGHNPVMPDSVKSESDRYFDDHDPISAFIEDDLEIRKGDNDSFVLVTTMMSVYESHSNRNGRTHALGDKRFRELLRRHGLKQGRKTIDGVQQRVWFGVKLTEQGCLDMRKSLSEPFSKTTR